MTSDMHIMKTDNNHADERLKEIMVLQVYSFLRLGRVSVFTQKWRIHVYTAKNITTNSKELCHEIYQNSNRGNRCQTEWNIKITIQKVRRGYKWQNKYKRKHGRKNSKKIETNSSCSFRKLVGLSSVLVVSNNCCFWETAHLPLP